MMVVLFALLRRDVIATARLAVVDAALLDVASAALVLERRCHAASSFVANGLLPGVRHSAFRLGLNKDRALDQMLTQWIAANR
jgi:hypothetical protein